MHYYTHNRNGDILVREPLSLGHESAGVVSSVGSAVTDFKVGDKVEAGQPVAVVDGLKGFPEAIAAVFPDATVQTCIVHLLRQSLAFVSHKDRKAVAAALKDVYRAVDATAGEAALAAFEDAGYYAVNNLPVPLLVDTASYLEGSGQQRVAIALDVKSGPGLDGLAEAMAALEQRGWKVRLLFLDATVETLVKRFSETRRRHPFSSGDRTLTEAIEGEGIKADAPKAGAGAAVGAIIGGILGGVKGALAGVLIGGGGVVAATEGKEIELPAGAVLRVRVDSPVAVSGR